ncbi:uncharacterized protein B0T23DRAFT_419013 [Neurospora hispaniola]|uniref:Uncharacterized protein n=1 Tax=Neurospora hispaniola TaxID=588809 RepID=A0AAJ0MS09_9PEZI|nr:hypothetical protein B0T23DRAFT_419013 [Neurospora hispaniola]
MSTELPKTPQPSPKPVEGEGESTRAIDEVIDTPEALRRLAKGVKDILEGMNGEPNAFEHPGDHPGTDNCRSNDNLDVPEDKSLFDISDFGCHDHVEEAKETREQKHEGIPINDIPSITKVGAKLAVTLEAEATADGITGISANLPRKSEQLPFETENAHQREILLPPLHPRYTLHPTRKQRRASI